MLSSASKGLQLSMHNAPKKRAHILDLTSGKVLRVVETPGKLGDIEMDATILPADHPRSGVPVTVVGDGQPSRESRAAQNLLQRSAELQKG